MPAMEVRTVSKKRPTKQEQRVEEMFDEIDRREAELDELYEAAKGTFDRYRKTLGEIDD